MEKSEREFFSFRNIKWYEDTTVSTKDANSKKSNGTSKVSLYPLLNKKEKEENYDLYNQVRYVLKRLIEELYSNTKFYKEIIAKRSDFINEILNSIEEAANNLPKGQKIKTVEDLLPLELSDKQLSDTLYKILKGTKKEDSQEQALKKVTTEKAEGDKEEKPVEDSYLSLLDFITTDPRSKLRVYLAPKRTLLAITSNEELVNEILQQRKSLYQELKVDHISAETASNQFRELFSTRISSILNENFLDFSVTKTDPNSYE